jgi:hypothetical protein
MTKIKNTMMLKHKPKTNNTNQKATTPTSEQNPNKMETNQPSKKKAKMSPHNTDQPKKENKQELKMAQYNIWFNDFEMEKRTQAIGNIIVNNNIKIATFQEVTERSLTTLKQTLREYNFFRQRNCKYFVAMIVHKSIPTRDKQFHPFSSTTMGRGLLTIKVQPFQQPSNQPQQWITIGNCHLESPTIGNPNNNSRTEQLKRCKQIIKTDQTSGGLIMGDFNW